MSKPIQFACALLILALIPLLVNLRGSMPTDRQPLIEAKYSGWSGVLQAWCFEGWPSGAGTASAWLTTCVSLFEKQHPGIYVQVETVDEATMRRWNDGSMPAPDLLLFPPGLLPDTTGLAPLHASADLRQEFSRLGDWDGIRYALPVAMGGYLLLEAEIEPDEPLVPPAEPFRMWPAALASLASRSEADAPSPAESPDLDIGLPASGTALAAWRRFANGEAGALLTSQRELTRLTTLRDQGKAPDWRVAAVSSFTDQLLFVATPRSSLPERQALSAGFAASLAGEDGQRELHRSGLFPTTSCDGGYSTGDALWEMAARLKGCSLVAPRAFGTDWVASAQRLAQELPEEEPSAFIDALHRLLA